MLIVKAIKWDFYHSLKILKMLMMISKYFTMFAETLNLLIQIK